MTEEIQIKQYQAIVPNALWAEKRGLHIPWNPKAKKTREALELSTQITPTIEEVIEHIPISARRIIDGTSFLPIPEDSAREIVKSIAENDQDIIEHARDHIPGQYETRDQYLILLGGPVPTYLLDALKDIGDEGNPYDPTKGAFARETEENDVSSLKVKLYDGHLPDRSEVDTLLKHRVLRSNTLQVIEGFDDYGSVRNIMERIYDSLDDQSSISLLRDDSIRGLDTVATGTIISTVHCVQRGLARSPVEMLQRMFSIQSP